MNLPRTTLVTLILSCATSVVSFGQGLTGKGVKVGLNLASVRGNEVEDSETRTGFAAGGFLTYGFDQVWAIQGEVIYTLKGAGDKIIRTSSAGPDEIARYDVSWNLGYVEVPILVQARIPTTGSVKPGLAVGLSPAFNVVSTVTFESNGESETFDLDDINSFDLGLVLSGSVGIDIGPGEVIAEIRYTHGLLNTNENVGGSEAFLSDEFVGNGAISFLAGFSFK